MRAYILDYGRMKLDKNNILAGSVHAGVENPHRPCELLEIPMWGCLIDTPAGYVLFDLGVYPDCMDEEKGWPEIARLMYSCTGVKEGWVVNRLQELGIKPDDIKCLVLSHMHLDHAGSVEHFPNAQIYVHQKEFDTCLRDYALKRFGNTSLDDVGRWINGKFNWNLLTDEDEEYDLAEGCKIINLGQGHCPGLLALMISLPNTGNILLPSDAFHTKANYDLMKTPGLIYDSMGWMATARKVRRLEKKYNAKIWFAHDMEQFKTLKKSTEGYYD